jgi:hypothetical protein
VSQERRGLRAFSPNVLHRVNVLHRGALDRHPVRCKDQSGVDLCGALLRPVEQASAGRANSDTEHAMPRTERLGSRDKGESE